MDFGEAIPIPLDTADGFTVGRDDLTPPPRGNRVKHLLHCKKNLPYPEGGWGNLLGFGSQTVARPESLVGFMGKTGTP